MSMFCYQCEQTAKGMGCVAAGVCGKDATTAALQDLLVYAVKGISMYARQARFLGADDRAVDVFVIEALFFTVTNVNFDPARMQDLLKKAAGIRDKARSLYEWGCKKSGNSPERPQPAGVRDAAGAEGPAREVQRHPGHDAGGGPEGDTRVTGLRPAHRAVRSWSTPSFISQKPWLVRLPNVTAAASSENFCLN